MRWDVASHMRLSKIWALRWDCSKGGMPGVWDMLQHTNLSGDVAFRQVNAALKNKICHSNSSVAKI